ncbi:hypothetical protein HAX54_015403, partial [Datura stramonium]|nr:hypothetical protein [Datura stramonium]
MVASEMLKYGYQSKTGLEVKFDCITKPIQLKNQNNTFGIGYETTIGKACNMQSGKKVFVLEKVLALGHRIPPEPDQCIIEGIENLFIAMTQEDNGEEKMDLQMLTIYYTEARE